MRNGIYQDDARPALLFPRCIKDPGVSHQALYDISHSVARCFMNARLYTSHIKENSLYPWTISVWDFM